MDETLHQSRVVDPLVTRPNGARRVICGQVDDD